MNIKKLIKLDNGLRIFDNKYRVLISCLLYEDEEMNFNSILKEINIDSSKLAHHLNQLINLGFIEKKKLENGLRGESSYKLTSLGKESIKKLMDLSFQEAPIMIAPRIDDLTWHDRMRAYKTERIFNGFFKKSINVWVETPQMPELMRLLEDIFIERGRKLYLKGASFTGKSSTIRNFLKSKDALVNGRGGYGYKNGVLNILSPLEPKLHSLYFVILARLMGDSQDDSLLERVWTTKELKKEVLKKLETTNLKLIIIDDINYFAHYGKRRIQKFYDEVIELAEQFKASIVLVDLDEDNYKSPFIDMFPDFEEFLLKRLDKNETKNILIQFEKIYDMPLMTGLGDVLESIYRASEGRIGCIDRILRDTGAYALRHGISKLNNNLVHINCSFWFHRKDEGVCDICGFGSWRR